MKYLFFFACCIWSFTSVAQVFSIPDTSALLVKTTSQSPAHWYIKIISDIETDTVLRWKATGFANIPSEWQISLDDQTTFHPNVEVGDSADFNLLANQEFGTKLIIGAMLNGTPGHGICYFEVYDPDNPSVVQVVSYEFIVTASTNGLKDLEDSFLEWNGEFLSVKECREASFEVFDLNGKRLINELTTQFNVSKLPKNQLVIIQVKLDNRIANLKLFN